MIVFVKRTSGVISGVYSNLQPGIAEEQINDNDPEVVVYLTLRIPRLLYNIYVDITALTGPQKIAVWADITSGTPAKWTQDKGVNAAAIMMAVGVVNGTTMSAANLTDMKIRMVTAYVQDNPKYLVNPAFDVTINIPGDMAVV